MKSNILKQDHEALIKLNKAMTPRERLMAFYHHSRWLRQFAREKQKSHQQPSQASFDLPNS